LKGLGTDPNTREFSGEVISNWIVVPFWECLFSPVVSTEYLLLFSRWIDCKPGGRQRRVRLMAAQSNMVQHVVLRFAHPYVILRDGTQSFQKQLIFSMLDKHQVGNRRRWDWPDSWGQGVTSEQVSAVSFAPYLQRVRYGKTPQVIARVLLVELACRCD